MASATGGQLLSLDGQMIMNKPVNRDGLSVNILRSSDIWVY